MVTVRFACAPSVPGVKCTLNGDIKYSDSRGLIEFYGLGIGDHTYSVEAPSGWQFVSGSAPFMGSIPQSGIMTIPVGWPTGIVFVPVFVFEEGEEAAAQPFGEYRGCTLFRYVTAPSYGSSCTTRRRYTVAEVKADIDALLGPEPLASFNFTKLEPAKLTYNLDELVYVHYKVKNNGEGAGIATIVVKDRDTGGTITTYGTPELLPGYSFETSGSGAYVRKMPNRDLRLEFTVTP